MESKGKCRRKGKSKKQVHENNDNLRKDIVKIAMREFDAGIREDPEGSDSNHPDGFMHSSLGEPYGPHKRAQWCAMFASWVWLKANAPLLTQSITNSRRFKEWAKAHGLWKTS